MTMVMNAKSINKKNISIWFEHVYYPEKSKGLEGVEQLGEAQLEHH
jgi:hypothetical protein